MITFLFLTSIQIRVKCVGLSDKQYYQQYKEGDTCFSLDERYAQRVDENDGFECLYPRENTNYNKETDITPCIQCLPGFRRLWNDECKYVTEEPSKLQNSQIINSKIQSRQSCTVNSNEAAQQCPGGQVCIPDNTATTTGTCYACDPFSTQQTVINNNCRCREGFAAAQPASPVQVCRQCPRGFYTAGVGSGRPTCAQCPIGTTTSSPGSFTDAACFKEINQWIVVGITIGIFLIIVIITIIILYIRAKSSNKIKGPKRQKNKLLSSQEKPDLLKLHTGVVSSVNNETIVPSTEVVAEQENKPEKKGKKSKK